MKEDLFKLKSPRRTFIGTLAAGAASLGLASLAPIKASAYPVVNQTGDDPDPDDIFKNIKGKHRMVFDVPAPHEIFPFVWPRVYLMTNMKTGAAPKDINAVVVLRHSAIPYAFKNEAWQKYNFGEVFKMDDAQKNPLKSNPFYMPAKGAYKVPGFGEVEIGINELQDSGVLFVVCDAAMTVYSNVVASKMNLDPADVKKDWIASLVPNVKPVPSGVWAVGRAQEHGCGYCFVG